MAKQSQIPWFLPLANSMVKTLLRIGIKLTGPGKYPMYLITVRGRKSGQPRTTPIAVVEQDGKRYLLTPYGAVDWVRNLRAAGEASFTRGRRTEQMRAIELPEDEAAVVLKRFIETGNPIIRLFGITRETTPEDLERMLPSHPVFLLQSATATVPAAARQARPA
jgi:deazaflavin-dependent oxidoreductase (nitroreductase family)